MKIDPFEAGLLINYGGNMSCEGREGNYSRVYAYDNQVLNYALGGEAFKFGTVKTGFSVNFKRTNRHLAHFGLVFKPVDPFYSKLWVYGRQRYATEDHGIDWATSEDHVFHTETNMEERGRPVVELGNYWTDGQDFDLMVRKVPPVFTDTLGKNNRLAQFRLGIWYKRRAEKSWTWANWVQHDNFSWLDSHVGIFGCWSMYGADGVALDRYAAVGFDYFEWYTDDNDKTGEMIIRDVAAKAQSFKELRVEKRFSDDFKTTNQSLNSVLWPYRTANLTTADIVDQRLRLKASNNSALANHGLLLAGDDADSGNLITGHNRWFSFTAEVEANGRLGVASRIGRRLGETFTFDRGYVIAVKPRVVGVTPAHVYVYRFSGTTLTLQWDHTLTFPIDSGKRHTFEFSALDRWHSLWVKIGEGSHNVVTIYDGELPYAYAPEFYGLVCNSSAYSYYDDIYSPACDNIFTGVDGHVGYIIHPADELFTPMVEVSEMAESMFFADGDTLVVGRMEPPPAQVDVFQPNVSPWEFKDNLFSVSTTRNDDEYFNVIKVIPGDGDLKKVVIESDVDTVFQNFLRTRYYFAEGITSQRELHDIALMQLKEGKRSRQQQTLSGFAQVGIDLRDRVRLQVHRIPDDESSPLDVDVNYLVDSYTLRFENGETPDFSMELTLVEA